MSLTEAIQGAVSATVFIWYPHDSAIGHASMYIGNWILGSNINEEIAKKFGTEFTLDQCLENMNEYSKNYVSWWPLSEQNSLGVASAKHVMSLETDIDEEREPPSVVYHVKGLNQAAMSAEWEAIKKKDFASWSASRKNCATVVFRVLKAGGVLSKMSAHKRIWFSANIYLTPKNIAQICNDLRDNNVCIKTKYSGYKPKSSAKFTDRMLNLR